MSSSSQKSVPFLDLAQQYKGLKKEIDAAIERVIDNCSFILGPEAQSFEEEFSKVSGIKHIVGCGNGTDALSLALEALEVGLGDEVITTPFTWISTAETIVHRRAKPVFVDISLEDFNIDPEKISAKITSKTKAIIAVHLFGQPARMPEICSLAKDNGLKVIEDGAQAHLAAIGGQPIGTFGDAVTFSFFPSKNLGAFGDAGAVGSNHPAIAEKIKLLRNHGQKEKHHFLQIGYNSRLDDMQAAILRAKLPHLAEWTQARQRCADLYRELLANQKDLILPNRFPKALSVHHLFVIRHPKRDALKKALAEKGIPSLVHYPQGLHLAPAFKDLNYQEKDFPLTEKVSQEVLSLPCYPELKEEQIEWIADSIREILDQI